MYLMKFAEAMIADQEKTPKHEKTTTTAQDHMDGSVLKRLYPGGQNREALSSSSSSVKSLPKSIPGVNHNLPSCQSRDRANSIDGQILRSLISMGTEDRLNPPNSGKPASASTTSHELPRVPSNSPAISNTSAHLNGSSDPPQPPLRTTGLLYNLLVNSDAQLHQPHNTAARLKQPASSNSPDCAAATEAKKHRLEDPVMQQNIHSPLHAFPSPAPVGFRRFSFGGYPSSRPERIAALIRPLGADRHRGNGESRFATRSSSLASTVSSGAASCTNSNPSILSALISSSPGAMPSPVISSPSDSGVDEPLDLTGRRIPATSVMQLAKKTARPLQSRVTELMKQAVDFALKYKTTFCSWLVAFRNCWHRLVLLGMAENALEFVVVRSTHTSEYLFGEGEQIMPWLLPSAQHRVWAPTQEFSEQITAFIRYLGQQGLSSEEYAMLRHAILLTAEQPHTLAVVGLQVIHTSRSNSLLLKPTEKIPAALDLSNLEKALIQLANFSRFQVAGLFCTHLRGEDTGSELMPLEARFQSAPPTTRRPSNEFAESKSILGSLICDNSDQPQPSSPPPPFFTPK